MDQKPEVVLCPHIHSEDKDNRGSFSFNIPDSRTLIWLCDACRDALSSRFAEEIRGAIQEELAATVQDQISSGFKL